jgi:hypothetical protein
MLWIGIAVGLVAGVCLGVGWFVWVLKDAFRF